MDDSFTQRVFFPFAQALSGKVQAFLPMSSQSWIKKKLIQGGYHQPNTIRLFIGTHLIMTVAPQAFMLVLLAIKGSIDTGGIVYMGLLTFAGFAFPILWLLQQSGKRQTSIQRALPDSSIRWRLRGGGPAASTAPLPRLPAWKAFKPVISRAKN
ncbi:MAG: hypothetical protein R2857_00375 [Vampirovibrionales bacterium]